MNKLLKLLMKIEQFFEFFAFLFFIWVKVSKDSIQIQFEKKWEKSVVSGVIPLPTAA